MRFGKLRSRKLANVLRGGLNRGARSQARDALRLRPARLPGPAADHRQAVKFARIIAATALSPSAAHAREESGERIFSPRPGAPRAGLRRSSLRHEKGSESSLYITILFSGYSTMPCAPASFSRGMMLRTVASSRMVLTATQSAIAELRNGRVFQRRQYRQHRIQIASFARSASSPLCSSA